MTSLKTHFLRPSIHLGYGARYDIPLEYVTACEWSDKQVEERTLMSFQDLQQVTESARALARTFLKLFLSMQVQKPCQFWLLMCWLLDFGC